MNKRTLSCMLWLLLLVPAHRPLWAQPDSIRMETETGGGPDAYYQNKYRYLDIRLSDEDHVLKFGIQPFKPSETFTFLVFSLHGGLEQKLGPTVSLVNELNAVSTWTGEESFHRMGYSLGGRYYVLKKKEMAQGKSGNNCQGVYGLFRMSDLVATTAYRAADPDSPTGRSAPNRGLDFSLKPEIGLGFQQRLDYHLYFDASIGINHDLLRRETGLQIRFFVRRAVQLYEIETMKKRLFFLLPVLSWLRPARSRRRPTRWRCSARSIRRVTCSNSPWTPPDPSRSCPTASSSTGGT
ncbi:MAG: hypothetical protein R2751_04485 [Bacteroidales bacterium]